MRRELFCSLWICAHMAHAGGSAPVSWCATSTPALSPTCSGFAAVATAFVATLDGRTFCSRARILRAARTGLRLDKSTPRSSASQLPKLCRLRRSTTKSEQTVFSFPDVKLYTSEVLQCLKYRDVPILNSRRRKTLSRWAFSWRWALGGFCAPMPVASPLCIALVHSPPVPRSPAPPGKACPASAALLAAGRPGANIWALCASHKSPTHIKY